MREQTAKAAAGRKPESPSPPRRAPPASPQPILALQQRVGNRAVGHLLQAKLRVGAPGDRREEEADRIADQVMRAPLGPVTVSSVPPLAQSKCADCEEEDKLQRKPDQALGPDTGAAVAPPIVHEALSAPGQPIDAKTCASMEASFGHDLGQVRLHTDSLAAASASAIGARAYTVRHNVVFGAGQFAPQTQAGRHLLAHEITHVLQQKGQPEPIVQRDMIYGSGYGNPYANNAAEVRSAKMGAWFPSTDDMAASAKGSGGGSGASKVAGLLQALKSKGAGSITELGLIGHANSTQFALGGTIKPGDDVYFDADATIDAASLAANAADVTAAKNSFAADAKIVLYGCHSGLNAKFLETMSIAFGVCVQGFSNEITYCIQWDEQTNKISSRGRVFVIDIHDPLQARPDCANFFSSVKSLSSDLKSCKGAPAKAPSRPTPSAELGAEPR